MISFFKWAEENRAELPVYKKEESSAGKRAGISYWAYPDGYVRSHYPDGYFMPIAADALQKMGNHKVKHMTPPDTKIGQNGEMIDEPEIDYETE